MNSLYFELFSDISNALNGICMNVYYYQVNLTRTNQASLASYLNFLFMLLKFPEQYKLLYLILNKNASPSKDYHPFITEALNPYRSV